VSFHPVVGDQIGQAVGPDWKRHVDVSDEARPVKPFCTSKPTTAFTSAILEGPGVGRGRRVGLADALPLRPSNAPIERDPIRIVVDVV
jgi:hypothetical protein